MTVQLSCNIYQLQQLRDFIQHHALQPGDAIIVGEEGNGLFRQLLDHYVIYLGEYYFMANFRQGTKILTCPTIYGFLPSMTVRRIRRFTGNAYQRQKAVNRALQHKDRKSYHLLANNCEHFANDVQFGQSYSDQVLIGGTMTTVVGLGLLSSSNPFIKGIGALLTTIGGITATVEINKRLTKS